VQEFAKSVTIKVIGNNIGIKTSTSCDSILTSTSFDSISLFIFMLTCFGSGSKEESKNERL